MKLLTAVALIAFAGAARAQEDAMKVGLALVEQTVPLRDCLKKEMAAAQSNETALAIAQNACADVSAALQPKLVETVRSVLDPVPPTIDPAATADGAIKIVRIAAYYEFTGEVKRFHDDLKKRAEERLKQR
jgi:hypothetical protein